MSGDLNIPRKFILLLIFSGFVCCSTTKPRSTTYETTTGLAPDCGRYSADVLFVIDGSYSIGLYNFKQTLYFINGTVSELVIGPHDTQIGMITFASDTYLQFYFNSYNTKQDVLNKVNAVDYPGGSTATDKALQFAKNICFSTTSGMRPDASHIAIIITDGQSDDKNQTAVAAKELRDQGVTIFSIGVGSGIDENELSAIATEPADKHVFFVDNFDSLENIKETVAQKVCDVNNKPTNKTSATYFTTTITNLLTYLLMTHYAFSI